MIIGAIKVLGNCLIISIFLRSYSEGYSCRLSMHIVANIFVITAYSFVVVVVVGFLDS
jgi:hypothetical protein